MAGKLRFDGKVVLVTGAGGGLGKDYALEFAARGAKVVVNDLGGDMSGGGKSSRAADVVVDEIRAKGGVACANYNSVEDGAKVVQTALDNYGKIDILINNAGILRDRSFARTSDQDWDLIHRVHLRGSFMVTRAAWPHMKDNRFGRILMTTSAAGIYGNFGQANYSAAKLGCLGLSNTLSIEGRKYNIQCNTIAPLAGSRLTATVMPEEMLNALKPEYVTPMVIWLSHDSCEATGDLFELGGGWYTKLRWQRCRGEFMPDKMDSVSAEDIRDNWSGITDFTDPQYPTSIGESSAYVYTKLLEKQERGGGPKPNAAAAQRSISTNPTANKIQPEKAIGAPIKPSTFSYTERDVILYALGIGVSTQQEDHLKFLFELNEDFCALPTYQVIPVLDATTKGMLEIQGLPINPMMEDHLKFLFELNEDFCVLPSMTALFNSPGAFTEENGLPIDYTKILHGEQYCELFKPLPTSATLTSKGRIADVLDKGSGAVILVDIEIFDEDGSKVAYNQTSIFVQKAGGFGGKRASDRAIQPINAPNRAPDASVQEKTSKDQAALYRLSGDRNPLHIDPDFAAMGGFSTPILHGLCSFGYAVRHVLQTYADNDVTRFKAVKVRFSKPVLPGETIQTDMWQDGSRIYFQCKVVESGATCLNGCYVDLHPAGAITANATAASSPTASQCETDVLMKILAGRISSQPEITKEANAIFEFNINVNKKPVSQWTVDTKSKPAKAYRGQSQAGKPDVKVTMEDSDFMDLATGKLQGPQAFLAGKMKLQGNIMLVQKLGTMLMQKAKL